MKYFGLHIDGKNLLVAVLNRRLKLHALLTLPINRKLNLKNKFLFQSKNFVTGLISSDVLIKETSLKIQKSSILKKALSLQSETLFPFENNLSIINYNLRKVAKNQNYYYLYGTTISKIRKCISSFEEKKITINTLSCEPMALARFVSAYFPAYKACFIVHIGENKTICTFLDNNHPSFAHTIRMGKNDLFEGLDPTSSFDLELIDESKKDETSIKWVKFKTSITQAFLSLKCKEKVYFLLSGHLDNAINIEKFLFRSIHENTLSYGKTNILLNEYNTISKHAISIGYCIDAIKNDEKSLQFIQKDCLPKKINSSFYKKIFCLLFASFTFLIISFQFQKKHFMIKSQEINHQFISLKSLDEVKMERKIDLSKYETIPAKINAFNKKISSENDFFPYYFDKIKPSNLLAKILKISKSTQLKTFSYEIINIPNLQQPNAKTVIKISLTLDGSKNDINKFEEMLLKTLIIDEITKNIENEICKISFFLK